MKRSQPRRDWVDARQKVEDEQCCRVCGVTSPLETAHVTGRVHDRPKTEGSKTLYVDPVSIVPLCRKHHGEYDAKCFDLLPYLTPEEQVRAVEDLGSIVAAYRRTAPTEYREVDAVGVLEGAAR